jgi:hypothetical protein
MTKLHAMFDPSSNKLYLGNTEEEALVNAICDDGSYFEIPRPTNSIPDIEEVIFNEAGNATVIRWRDNTKTIVRCGEGETFDRYTGFIACVAKKLFGGTTSVKKLMNSKDRKYQAALKAEKEEAEKAKRQQEAAVAKAKADKTREKKEAEAMEEFVKLFLMNTEAKQRAEEILRARTEEVPFEDVESNE